MVSAIDPTKPPAGAASTADVRNNFAAAKSEIEALQTGKQAASARLAALAAILLVADKLLYATGSDSFATADLTAFARTLLDDPDAATARTTLGAAPLASPVFTGTPAAPTAAAGTSSTQIATTAFVRAAINADAGISPNTIVQRDPTGGILAKGLIVLNTDASGGSAIAIGNDVSSLENFIITNGSAKTDLAGARSLNVVLGGKLGIYAAGGARAILIVDNATGIADFKFPPAVNGTPLLKAGDVYTKAETDAKVAVGSATIAAGDSSLRVTDTGADAGVVVGRIDGVDVMKVGTPASVQPTKNASGADAPQPYVATVYASKGHLRLHGVHGDDNAVNPGQGGNVHLYGGHSTVDSNKNAGGVYLVGGKADGSGTGGVAGVKAGDSTGAAGGPAYLEGGQGATTGGAAQVKGGPGAVGGSVSLLGGEPSNGTAGSVTIGTPDSVGTNKQGADLIVTVGRGTGTARHGQLQATIAGDVAFTVGGTFKLNGSRVATIADIPTGIADAYTKAQTDAKLAGKIDKAFLFSDGGTGITLDPVSLTILDDAGSGFSAPVMPAWTGDGGTGIGGGIVGALWGLGEALDQLKARVAALEAH
ncbi:hypothetical protein [Azospirillum sp. TSH64]|uniref:hypothetical protein n=1 Tax=Azospirillum sp. TSH64 TaxID=652740 RepID=UPI000D621272|nr:hypothetical protein [Azospirillum sp. TSH64]PWC74065.1 hypothetical protein TSH64_02680 [Azospirillum sp. TSH64]